MPGGVVVPYDHAWPRRFEAEREILAGEPGSDLRGERLAFRDALRADAAVAAEYGQWKVTRAARQGDPAPYGVGKTAFVSSALAPRGIVVKPDDERLSAASGFT